MAIRSTRRGGAGAGRGDNPHADRITQAVNNWNPDAERAGAMSKSAPKQPAASSGRQRFQLEGGGYLRTTPTQGSTNQHDVTVYNDKNVPQYSVKNASFGHNAKTGEAKFFGGTDTGSGQAMSHTWTGKTIGGNLHQDNSPF